MAGRKYGVKCLRAAVDASAVRPPNGAGQNKSDDGSGVNRGGEQRPGARTWQSEQSPPCPRQPISRMWVRLRFPAVLATMWLLGGASPGSSSKRASRVPTLRKIVFRKKSFLKLAVRIH